MVKKRQPPLIASDLHLRQVLKDVEFQKRLTEIKAHYSMKFSKYKELNDFVDFGTEVMVVNDENTGKPRLYLELNDDTPKDTLKQINDLAEDYWIDPMNISWLINEQSMANINEARRSRAQVEVDDKGVLLRIEPNTYLDDVIEQWPWIEEVKRLNYVKYDSRINKYRSYKPTKNKPPEDPELVYAVFRARRQNRTFPAIFKDYQDGTLPLYIDKPTNNFSSSKALETYYNKHKPTA